MVGRGELTDQAWEQIASHLPDNGAHGQQWRNHRQVINGIPWKLRTGTPWRDLPDRFVRWRHDGTWDQLLTGVQTKSDVVGTVVWEVSVGNRVVRAISMPPEPVVVQAGATEKGGAASGTRFRHAAINGDGALTVDLSPSQRG